jgi:peptide deformylase
LVVQDERREPVKVINPTIKDTDGESYILEGCLSIPGFYTKIRRAEEVTIEYFNENGELKTTINNGLLGRAILHEMDHLLGLTIFDRLSKIDRSTALNKWKKIRRKIK